MAQCEGPECDKEVHRAGLCRGHYEQQKGEKPLTPLRAYGRTRTDALIEAALAFADADAENDSRFWAARKRLLKMAAQLRRELRGPAYQKRQSVQAA